MTLPVKKEELWHQVSVVKNGADTTLVVDRASRTLRSNGDHSTKVTLGVDPGDPVGSASGGTGSGGSSSKQYGPRKDSDSMAFGDLYSNGYVFVGGLPSWYSEKMDSVVLPTTLLEPRLRGSVRSLKYRDMRSSSERQQDMMAYKVRNLNLYLNFYDTGLVFWNLKLWGPTVSYKGALWVTVVQVNLLQEHLFLHQLTHNMKKRLFST